MLAPKIFLIDVDGVMTDGCFYYTADGKAMKRFGPDDHDALSLLKPHVSIVFVTGDSKGLAISQKRIVEDMNFPLELVSTVQRIDWISANFVPEEVAYMGDGIFDHYVFREVGYSIAPANACSTALKHADYVTGRRGGDRAVADASLHLLEKFFGGYDPLKPLSGDISYSGKWAG
jgi:3-deoxy-D-manno-octulosonate 8-phosphate phosphatase (KDO 8-P phosphatase)